LHFVRSSYRDKKVVSVFVRVFVRRFTGWMHRPGLHGGRLGRGGDGILVRIPTATRADSQCLFSCSPWPQIHVYGRDRAEGVIMT
jgi:hypothetical protein